MEFRFYVDETANNQWRIFDRSEKRFLEGIFLNVDSANQFCHVYNDYEIKSNALALAEYEKTSDQEIVSE